MTRAVGIDVNVVAAATHISSDFRIGNTPIEKIETC